MKNSKDIIERLTLLVNAVKFGEWDPIVIDSVIYQGKIIAWTDLRDETLSMISHLNSKS